MQIVEKTMIAAPVIPVVVIDDVKKAIGLARAFGCRRTSCYRNYIAHAQCAWIASALLPKKLKVRLQELEPSWMPHR